MSCADAVSWALIGGLAGACILLGHSTGFGVAPAGAALAVLGLAALGAMLAIGRRRGDARLATAMTALLQMTLFTVAGVVLAFLLAARAAPLWDGRLASADRSLGLNWPAILTAADALPAPLLALGGIAYHSLAAQMVVCILVLAGTEQLERLRVMVAVAVGSGVLTILISGALPAIGNIFDPARYTALSPSVAWRDRALVMGLRDGSIRQIDLAHLTGIVSFPSYHAALSLILAWGLWPIAGARVPALVWAGLTIVATPLFGGHYAVDVLAGMLLAAVALVVAKRLFAGRPDQVAHPRWSAPAFHFRIGPSRSSGQRWSGHDLV